MGGGSVGITSPGGVVTFGELLVRLAPPAPLRLEQAGALEVAFGGAEANVAVSLSRLGTRARFVSRLPDNPLAAAGLRTLRGLGVDIGAVLSGGQRVGLYFVEHGSAQRPSRVIYDRADSGMASIQPGMVPWGVVLGGWSWFHTSGITPALSRAACATTLEAVSAARGAGLRVSIDLNYRATLWGWGRSPAEVMAELVGLADVVFCNELDLRSVFSIPVPHPDSTDAADPSAYEPACRELQRRFPNVEIVAMTLRSSLSASHNRWTGVMVDRSRLLQTRRYDITPIADRVGTGDAFAAGAIDRMMRDSGDLQGALNFAVAASCLKHSVAGDFNLTSPDEVCRLVAGEATGRIVR